MRGRVPNYADLNQFDSKKYFGLIICVLRGQPMNKEDKSNPTLSESARTLCVCSRTGHKNANFCFVLLCADLSPVLHFGCNFAR